MKNIQHVILTNMCMITNPQGQHLVILRKDPSYPGLAFPGGHIDPLESFVESVKREIKEETNLTIKNLELCGIKQFTHQDGSYRYMVLLYKTTDYEGVIKSSDEGAVFWLDPDAFNDFPLTQDFMSLYEVFINPNITEQFHYIEHNTWHLKHL